MCCHCSQSHLPQCLLSNWTAHCLAQPASPPTPQASDSTEYRQHPGAGTASDSCVELGEAALSCPVWMTAGEERAHGISTGGRRDRGCRIFVAGDHITYWTSPASFTALTALISTQASFPCLSSPPYKRSRLSKVFGVLHFESYSQPRND